MSKKQSIFLIITIILLTALVVNHDKYKKTKIIRGKIKLSTLDSQKLYEDSLLQTFNPDYTKFKENEHITKEQPNIAGESAILVDINSENILYKKEINKKLPIASLVKIMTAVVALEHKNPSDDIFVSKRSAQVGENTMGISENEIYTLEELLYGLILHSGNDAAYAIAEGTAPNVDIFVDWMNIKAERIGLKNTYFADPSGLNDKSYSTPADLVKLTKYALKHPKFKEIVKTVEHEIYSDENNKYIYLYNQTNLLTTYPGVAGVKTGFTEDAGLCLVTYAKNNGKELVGVVLNSIDRRGDMILMLDHGFKSLGIMIEHNLF